jgi:hypothetical protein
VAKQIPQLICVKKFLFTGERALSRLDPGGLSSSLVGCTHLHGGLQLPSIRRVERTADRIDVPGKDRDTCLVIDNPGKRSGISLGAHVFAYTDPDKCQSMSFKL